MYNKNNSKQTQDIHCESCEGCVCYEKQEGPEGPGMLTWDRRFLKVPFFSLLYVQQATLGGLNLKAIVLKFKSNVCKRIF